MDQLSEVARQRMIENRERALRIQEERRRVAAATACPPSDGGSTCSAAPARSHSNTEPSLAAPSPSKSASAGMTEAERALRERNRQIALQRRELSQRAAACSSNTPSTSSSTISCAPPPTLTSPVKDHAPLFRPRVTVTFTVQTAQRFKATCSPFSSSVINAYRSVSSRIYEEKQRVHTFLLTDIQQVTKALNEVKDADVTVVTIPENVIRALMGGDARGGKDAFSSDVSHCVDPSLLKILFPFQRTGVLFGLEKSGRVLIADEMGLGKSVQALAIARFYREEWPLVIICPSSVKSAWKIQINKFLPCIRNMFILEKEKDPMPEHRSSNTVVIMSYEQLTRRRNELLEKHYMVYIFDESHYLKDSNAQRTKAGIAIAKQAQRVILLTGTPALSRPAELFTQIKMINPRIFTNFKDFAVRYCDGKDGRFCFEAKGCTNSEELSAIMQRRLMIRRLKNDVLTDLPEKRREIVYLDSEEVRAGIEAYKRSVRDFDKLNFKKESFDMNDQGVLEYYTQTGNVKARPVCQNILENYFYEGAPERKVLIFAHHQIVLDTICAELANKCIKHIRIDGRTPSEKRGPLCDAFQNDEEVRVAALSITAAGQGITLTAASVVVFAEIYWIPGCLMQAEDRAHRVGQKDSVFVQYMLAKDTADDIIWPMVKQKLQVLGQVNLNSENFTETTVAVVRDDEDTITRFTEGHGNTTISSAPKCDESGTIKRKKFF